MATNGENSVCFPEGTIFRASVSDIPGARITAFVKANDRLKILRYRNYTWTDQRMADHAGHMENMPVDEFITHFVQAGWTLTADVRPPKDWWNEAGREWRRALPPGAPHAEIVRVTQAAYAKAREGWAEYVRRLQALYPAFTAVEDAPLGTNVPLRLVAPQPQPQPQLLMPPARPETITLTRDQMNQIYSIAYGRNITDDAWATMKQIAAQ